MMVFEDMTCSDPAHDPGCPCQAGGDVDWSIPVCPECGRGPGPDFRPTFPAGYLGPRCPSCDFDDPLFFEGSSFWG